MMLTKALAAGATVVSLAFALSTLERALDRGHRRDLAWTAALAMFSVASAALWLGASFGWGEWSFRVFYLFGAVLNVPFLALGTIYLLGSRATGDRTAAGLIVAGSFAAGLVLFAPLGPIPTDELPQGSDVFGAGPRVAAALASTSGAVVILAGALWSAARHRLVATNLLIAGGVVVLSLGGLGNSLLAEMDAFAVSLAVGVTLLFVGSLAAGTPPSPP